MKVLYGRDPEYVLLKKKKGSGSKELGSISDLLLLTWWNCVMFFAERNKESEICYVR